MSSFIGAVILFGMMGLALSIGAILGKGGLKCHCNDGSCATEGKGGAKGAHTAGAGCCGQHSDCRHSEPVAFREAPHA